ncbi:MAG: FAD:protein FMN transferase [Kiritimatiellia bacterium]
MEKFSHKAMDTEFSVSFGLTEDPSLCGAAAAAVFDRIDALELLLSRFNDTSDVAVVRGLSPGRIATVAAETMDLLVTATRVCAATGGAFDPTVGPIMDRLRAAGATWDALPREARDEAFARGGMQRLVLDVEHRRVSVTADALGRATPLELDFGGIGKGFALDEAARILKSEQFEIGSCLLDAGTSTLLAWGDMDGTGRGWPLGVGGVWKKRTRLETVVRLTDGAALSGSGFEIRGQHVVDVRKRAAAGRWAQTWAYCPTSAAVADALSTAALALDPGELAGACQELSARVLVAREQKIFLDRFRDPLKWYF